MCVKLAAKIQTNKEISFFSKTPTQLTVAYSADIESWAGD